MKPLGKIGCFNTDPSSPPPEPEQKPCGLPMTILMGRKIVIEIAGTVDQLSKVLGATAGRAVIDKTGILGTYDMRLEFALDQSMPGLPEEPSEAPGVTLFTAIQEQLGLRLESTKGRVGRLVVKSVERPSDN